MAAFVALLMTVAVFVAVGYPLLRPGRGKAELAGKDDGALADLLAERDAACATIEEAEFELQLGNLSQQDYEELRARYRRRVEDIARELEAMR